MNLLNELFNYDTWATLQLIDFCAQQSPTLLEQMVAGTDRSILHTFTHMIGSEQSYLERVAGEKIAPPIRQGEILALSDLRRRCEAFPQIWERGLAGMDQIDLTLPAEEDYPSTPHAQNVLVLQAIQHGIDHRTQICTTLSTLDLQPPDIDMWAYWLAAHLTS